MAGHLPAYGPSVFNLSKKQWRIAQRDPLKRSASSANKTNSPAISSLCLSSNINNAGKVPKNHPLHNVLSQKHCESLQSFSSPADEPGLAKLKGGLYVQ
jgi:hypothetical protein